jgi:DNA-binding response OmpR family regulator
MRIEMAVLARKLALQNVVTEEQFEAATRHATAKRMPVEKALIELKLVTPVTLGRFLSDYHRMPYVRLPAPPLAGLAATLLSPHAALSWNFFPVAYQPDINVMTIAVSDPETMTVMERIRRLLLLDFDFAFTVACAEEIEESLRGHWGLEATVVRSERHRLPDLEKSSFPAVVRDAAAAAVPGEAADKGGDVLPLVEAAAELHLGADPNALRDLRARARYCGLLSARLQFAADQRRNLMVSAWLTAFEGQPDAHLRLRDLKGVGPVLYPAAAMSGDVSMEALVLALVTTYVMFRRDHPDAARDIIAVRRHLRAAWSSLAERQEMIEAFLQIMADETYLDSSGAAGGRVLLAAPADETWAGVLSRLRAENVKASIVSDEETLWLQLRDKSPDALVVAATILPGGVERFLRRIREDQRLSKVPVLIVENTGDPALTAQHLRAGAADVLSSPVDTVLLAARLEKALATRKDVAAGVGGSLSEMSFTDMIQVLSAGGRTVEIRLSRDQEEGRVVLDQGRVIHASAGAKTGEDAFYALMRWSRGTFQTAPCHELPACTIQASVMSLLMEGARRVDEHEPA